MNSLLETVSKIIDERINPLLAVDRGSVEVVDVNEQSGLVKVRYRGRCAGCPALSVTHRKVVTAALLAADRTIRKVEYTLLDPLDEGK